MFLVSTGTLWSNGTYCNSLCRNDAQIAKNLWCMVLWSAITQLHQLWEFISMCRPLPGCVSTAKCTAADDLNVSVIIPLLCVCVCKKEPTSSAVTSFQKSHCYTAPENTRHIPPQHFPSDLSLQTDFLLLVSPPEKSTEDSRVHT